jgi:hypothetical protein
MTTSLCEPVLQNGVRNTHFFNGRLLAAEDLQTEQAARRRHDSQLAQAIGSGVVNGLEVSLLSSGAAGTDAIVAIRAGLALAPSGQSLQLAQDVEVVLVRRSGSPEQAGDFSDCTSERLATLPTGVGFYLLLVHPAMGLQERAPMSGLGGGGKITGCGDRFEVEGVRFRLVKLDLSAGSGVPAATATQLAELMSRTNVAGALATDAADLSTLRNRLAHVCFGTEALDALVRNPFAAANGRSSLARYGALDALVAADRISTDDVPLALLYWTSDRVRFVDMWSVRRRAHGVRFFDPRAPADQSGTAFEYLPLDVLLGARRKREAEATWLQFQEHIESARRDGTDLATLRATEYFRYLPPAGLLPVRGPGSASGIDHTVFFGDGGSGDLAMLDGDQLRDLLDSALHFAPIDTSRSGRIQLYLLWENTRSVDAGAVDQRALVFAAPGVSYRGTARFNPQPDTRPTASPAYARWARSRFARRVI